MTGREKIIQMLIEEDNLLERIADHYLKCPSSKGLKDHCQSSCMICWCMALEEKQKSE